MQTGHFCPCRHICYHMPCLIFHTFIYRMNAENANSVVKPFVWSLLNWEISWKPFSNQVIKICLWIQFASRILKATIDLIGWFLNSRYAVQIVFGTDPFLYVHKICIYVTYCGEQCTVLCLEWRQCIARLLAIDILNLINGISAF